MKDFFKYLLATITGLILFSFIAFLLMFAIIAGMASMGEQEVIVKENTVLHLKLQGNIVDKKQPNPFDDLNFLGNDDMVREMGMNQILSCINKAAVDDDISGILLNPGMFSTGMSTLKEIREALERYKESGKFLIAYASNYTQGGYYVASVADTVLLNPLGILEIRGLTGQYTFFKKAMDKLGIKANIVKVGTYKSAIEPFTREEMSPKSREQTEVLIQGLWAHFKAVVSEGRQINPELIEKYAEEGMTFGDNQFLLRSGLIDALMYDDEVTSKLNVLSGKDADAKENLISVRKYYKAPEPKRDKKEFTRDKIAVIFAQGGIDDGSNNGIKSRKLSETIRKARKDKNIKAIVLRVNSPGGSAFGSEQVWREVVLAREEKPFIASMGNVAASGGYYIACAAHTIMAQPTTITGSIGIFGMFPDFEGLTNKLGISFDYVKTHDYADMPNVMREMSGDEHRLLQRYVARGYDTFLERCAEGRHTTKEKIDVVAQGRVWTGADAKEKGLVDKLGGLHDAVELAAEMAGLENYRIKEMPKEKELLELILEDFQNSVSQGWMRFKLGGQYDLYEQFVRYQGLSGIQARAPYELKVY